MRDAVACASTLRSGTNLYPRCVVRIFILLELVHNPAGRPAGIDWSYFTILYFVEGFRPFPSNRTIDYSKDNRCACKVEGFGNNPETIAD